MNGNGTYDFMTYYGALSLRKWVRYTEAQDFELHVTARGRYAIVMEYADAWAYPSTIEEGKRFEFDDADFAKHVIPIGCKMRQNTHGTVPVLVGFRIETASDCDVHSLGWFAHVDKVRDVTLTICTTTFRKEKYIRANIAKIKRDILYGDEADYAKVAEDDGFDEASRHLVMNVVDNGRTLPVDELEGNGVHVFPNPNAGGAGGFARGMIESIDEHATHALMMDDDVQLLDLGLDIDGIEPCDATRDYNRNIAERGKDFVTYLGHDLTKLMVGRSERSDAHDGGDEEEAWYYSQADKVAIMVRDAGAYQAGEIRNADVIVAIDLPNKRVSIRRRDNDRFGVLYRRFRHDIRQVKARDTELRQAYKDAAARMHTRGAWERYLGLDAGAH